MNRGVRGRIDGPAAELTLRPTDRSPWAFDNRAAHCPLPTAYYPLPTAYCPRYQSDSQ